MAAVSRISLRLLGLITAVAVTATPRCCLSRKRDVGVDMTSAKLEVARRSPPAFLDSEKVPDATKDVVTVILRPPAWVGLTTTPPSMWRSRIAPSIWKGASDQGGEFTGAFRTTS